MPRGGAARVGNAVKANKEKAYVVDNKVQKSHDALDPKPPERTRPLDPHEAAHKIQRAWKKMKEDNLSHEDKFIKRHVFLQRLELEDGLLRGFTRLILYCCIFTMVLDSQRYGVSSDIKLSVAQMLDGALDLEHFEEIQTLDGLRDYLPDLSQRLKQFSASSSSRLPNLDAIEIISERTLFKSAIPLLTIDPPVSSKSFTLSVWVELTKSVEERRLSILRKPLQTDRSVNCWGWYFPSQFRYGAGDFHSIQLEPEAWEEVVSASEVPDGLGPFHEVLIVEDGNASFYRNSEYIGSSILPRNITDCITPDTMEVGDEDLRLSSLKFYPTALRPNQVSEMFEGGKPLVELATGTVLRRIEEDSLQQARIALEEDHLRVISAVHQSEEKTTVSSRLSAADVKATADGLEANYPPDTSPAARLSDTSMALHLTDRERQSWINGGSPTGLHHAYTLRWVNGSIGRYWSVFEDPIFVDGSPGFSAARSELPYLPFFEDDADGFALSFWFRSMDPSELYPGGNFVFEKPDQSARIQVTFDASWSQMVGGPSGDSIHCEDFLVSQEEQRTGQMEEKYYMTSVATSPSPAVWRYLTYQYDRFNRTNTFYIDGKLVWRCTDGTRSTDPIAYSASYSVNEMIGNASVFLYPSYYNSQPIQGKAAQMRVYPKVLSDEELDDLHEESRWPDGSRMRQCTHEDSDYGYFDSIKTDMERRSCSWYSEVVKTLPQVCQTEAAKEMCPVTCSGKRLCHDGSIHPAGYIVPVPRRRIFDRIMHLTPRDTTGTIVCPSRDLLRSQVLADCERFKSQNNFYRQGSGYYNYSYTFEQRSWKRGIRTDVRDCELLAKRLDEEQCSWDSSWLPLFQEDFAETGTWSINFWVHKKRSYETDRVFYPDIRLFSRLAPALLVNDFQQRNPDIDPWMDVSFFAEFNEAIQGPWLPHHIVKLFPMRPPSIRFDEGWTFFYSQMEKMADGTYRVCAAMNAMPASCSILPSSSSPLFDANAFIQAVEYNDEMLVSPIEITTEALTPSQIQKFYYQRAVRMEKVLGPEVSELERLEIYAKPQQRQLRKFDERLALLAPPIVFTTRKEASECNSKVTQPFFEAQLDLMREAHCLGAECPDLQNQGAVGSCLDGELAGSFFGFTQDRLHGQDGYSDFLYTIGDASLVVRQGQTLATRSFLDSQTQTSNVLAIFHLMQHGLTTSLELRSDLERTRIKNKVVFKHYEFVPASRRGLVIVSYVFFLLLLIFLFIAIGHHFYTEVFDARIHERAVNMWVALECAFDVVQCLAILGFACWALDNALKSEERAEEIMQEVASVSFESTTMSFHQKKKEYFEAVDKLTNAMEDDRTLTSVVFFVMVVTCLRIIAATHTHPRTGVITGTLVKSLNELWHFTLIFVLIFIFFSLTATLMFGTGSADFGTVSSSMMTQFHILLGSIPESMQEDLKLVIYVVLCNIIQFFLLLNFLLAIIVDGFMKVREDIETNESENEFFTDLVITYGSMVKGFIQNWPSKKEAIFRLQTSVSLTRITCKHLKSNGLPDNEGTDKMFEHYWNMEALQTEAPSWVKKGSDEVFEAAVQSMNGSMVRTSVWTTSGVPSLGASFRGSAKRTNSRRWGHRGDSKKMDPYPKASAAHFSQSSALFRHHDLHHEDPPLPDGMHSVRRWGYTLQPTPAKAAEDSKIQVFDPPTHAAQPSGNEGISADLVLKPEIHHEVVASAGLHHDDYKVHDRHEMLWGHDQHSPRRVSYAEHRRGSTRSLASREDAAEFTDWKDHNGDGNHLPDLQDHVAVQGASHRPSDLASANESLSPSATHSLSPPDPHLLPYSSTAAQPLIPSAPQNLSPSAAHSLAHPQQFLTSAAQPLNPSAAQPLNPSAAQPLNPSAAQPLIPPAPVAAAGVLLHSLADSSAPQPTNLPVAESSAPQPPSLSAPQPFSLSLGNEGLAAGGARAI